MEFRSRCCFCVRQEKRTDKLSVCQQSIYCVKNARNSLSRKHCGPLDLLHSISSNKPGSKRSLRQFLRPNVLMRFCQIKFLVLITTQNHVDALLSIWRTFDMILKDNKKGMRCLFIFFFKREKNVYVGHFN